MSPFLHRLPLISTLALAGWISAAVTQTAVTGFALSTGNMVLNWTSTVNAKLQTNPDIAADGKYGECPPRQYAACHCNVALSGAAGRFTSWANIRNHYQTSQLHLPSTAALALWGDANDGVPTVVVLGADDSAATVGSAPVFTYVTPGSMFSASVVITSSNATADSLLVAVGGKAVPANVMGSGGDAFAWTVTVPK